MNGYLMQEKQWVPGEDLFIESFAPENSYGVVFEDDGEAAYFYAVERDGDGPGLRILDALHIHQSEVPEVPEQSEGNERGSRAESKGTTEVPEESKGTAEEERGGTLRRRTQGTGSDEGPRDDAPTKFEASGPTQPAAAAAASRLLIIWSRDWMKCALIIDGYVHALFDFEAQGGYNINEFPPPNDFWTKGDRKLTDELVRKFF